MPRKATAKRPTEYIGERVKAARTSRGWKQSELVDRLEELGYTQWRQSKVAKIENGEVKRIALEDALALAAALGVAFAYLLSPAQEDDDVEVAPKLSCSPGLFRAWLRGEWPLVPEDERIFFFGALVPDSEYKRRLSEADARGELVLTPGEVAKAGIDSSEAFRLREQA